MILNVLMSHISDKFLFLEFVVLILLSLFHIFFVEYRFVALSQVLNRYFTIGLISVSYLKARPLFTSEQQKLTVSFHMLVTKTTLDQQMVST